MEQFSPPFPLSAGSFAWIVLAVAFVGLLAWQLKTDREVQRIRKRLNQQSQSIGFMDDWADDVDARLSLLEDAQEVVNDNGKTSRSQPLSFLARKLRENSEAEQKRLSKERAYTIITGAKKYDPS